ncbi:flagellar hook capping FlgD N-terminal domain-containing protein [Paraburkholderia hayleyella]|uniref:flagellar hook capping FlgD N-terminal domain-containing protein n=1 Tax=Paraburkholderia hayleyella TaxID=2152889 RepID=UPI001FE61E50|nr:flagellar hook capping FlgD N-terminal domain-containing protein [Paraburkholderia hayleyella]
MMNLTPAMRSAHANANPGVEPLAAGGQPVSRAAVPPSSAPPGPDHGSGETPKPKENELSNLFTTLLVAQIQNQDPLAPMEASQFVTQFAQMHQIEVMQSLVSTSLASAALQESMLVVSLGSQVGSQVMVVTDSFELGSEPVKGGLTLEHAAADVNLILTGPDGQEHKISLGAKDSGDVNFTLDPAEHGLPPGQYAVRVETDVGEKPLVEIQGELQGVRLGPDGKIVLSIAGIGECDTASITRFLGRLNGSGETPPTKKGFWS